MADPIVNKSQNTEKNNVEKERARQSVRHIVVAFYLKNSCSFSSFLALYLATKRATRNPNENIQIIVEND